ncbi:MAG TPA: ABC transporter permease [Bacteroidales bacterium]|nr:ABC transporter permease [Bacteroidales bacterium]HPS63689.1 ABC transporter permease [Bacteroidales bacterium]
MFDLDRWQELYHVLKKNKLRTFLTAFGVFWGIFMLVIMMGSGKGLENGVTQNFGDMATNSVFIWAQQTSISYKGFPRGRYFNYQNSDIQALTDGIPEIRYLAPRTNVGGYNGSSNVIRGLKSGSFSIFGDYPVFNRIDPVNMLSGRFIDDFDIKEKRKVVVIGQRVQELLFARDEDPIGKYIQVQGVYFQVIGLFRSKRTGEAALQDNQRIHMPFTTLQRTFNYGDAIGFFNITSKDGIPVSVVEEKAMRILKKNHSVAPDDDRAIGHFNLEVEYRKMRGLFNGIRVLIWIVGTGTLLAGVIGVSNIMLVVVKERTREIGIQRALGATPSLIISQIITEAVVLTTFAGYFGLSVGVALLELINYLLAQSGANTEMFVHPGINFHVAVTALAILVVSGALAGFIPARRAISVKPIDALRYE